MKLLQNCKEYGYTYPAQFASALILDGYELYEKDENAGLARQAKQYLEIGDSASNMRGRKFSIAGSVPDHEKTVAGYDQVLEKGWITQEEYDGLVAESESEHKANVRHELSKKRVDDREKKKKKRKPTGPKAWKNMSISALMRLHRRLKRNEKLDEAVKLIEYIRENRSREYRLYMKKRRE